MKKIMLLLAFLPMVVLISCNNSDTNASQEENSVIPNITDRGVEPFFVGSSLLDISPKGSFYDTIILNKLFDWCETCGEMSGQGATEIEYLKIYHQFNGDIRIVRCYGVANVIKDGDTVMTIDYDENAQITEIAILSDMFKTENGIHVGMGASDLLKDFDARFTTQNDWFDGHSFLSEYLIVNVPSLPKHILLQSECTDEIGAFMSKKQEESGNEWDFDYECTLPSELVNNNTVSKIMITK